MTRREQIKQLWDAADKFGDLAAVMASPPMRQARELNTHLSRDIADYVANWTEGFINTVELIDALQAIGDMPAK